MNNEPEFDPTLESELRQIRPAKMDEALLERISHTAANSSSHPQTSTLRSHRWLWLIPITATAVIVLALTLSPQKPDDQPDKTAAKSSNKPTKEETIELFPVSRNNQIVEAINEGIIHIEGRQPYRSVRMQVVDSYQWAQPNGVTRVQYQVPREERLLVPATIY